MNMRSAILAAGLNLAVAAAAQTLLVDRGLPNANLNDAAGANRCNWAVNFGTDPVSSDDHLFYYMMADSFDLGDPYGGGPIKVDTIRVWVSPATDIVTATYQLLLGSGGGTTLTVAATLAGGTSVAYPDGTQYQTGSGTLVDLIQLDFPVNRTFAPNTRVYFAVSGVDAGGAFAPPYVHVSNAGLSGTPQQGADNLVAWHYSDDLATWLYGGTFDSNGHPLDKSVDVNVQVFGEPLWGANAGLKLTLGRTPDATELRIEGAQTGDTLAIQTSPDLVTWTTAETRTVDEAVEVFTDAGVAGSPRKFYRVVRTMAL